jgi:hypothetical protein
MSGPETTYPFVGLDPLVIKISQSKRGTPLTSADEYIYEEF